MRFLVLVKATPSTEAGGRPSPELAAEMAKYRDEMGRAGVLVDFSGLAPSSKGARVRLSAGKPIVIDGPFAETKELVAGYWVLDVPSKREALAWVKRCPNPHRIEAELEVRPLAL